jgi:hypothetical protein
MAASIERIFFILIAVVFLEPSFACDQSLWARIPKEFPKMIDAVVPEIWTGSQQQRLRRFLGKWPQNAMKIENVQFRIEDPGTQFPLTQSGRRALVLSFEGLSAERAQELSRDYERAFSSGTIAFSADGRLVTRIGRSHYMAYFEHDVYPNFYEGMNWVYRVRREVLFHLKPQEFRNLLFHFQAARSNFDGVIGPHLNPGIASGETNACLTDNRPRRPGEMHNCVTWATLAPIGPRGESIRQLAGAQIENEFFTNHDWWISYLLAAEKNKRVSMISYFTHLSLEKARELIPSGKEPQGVFAVPQPRP